MSSLHYNRPSQCNSACLLPVSVLRLTVSLFAGLRAGFRPPRPPHHPNIRAARATPQELRHDRALALSAAESCPEPSIISHRWPVTKEYINQI